MLTEELQQSVTMVRECRSREEWLSSDLRQILDSIPTLVFVAEDSDCSSMFGNKATEGLLRAPSGANVSKSSADAFTPRQFDVYDVTGHQLQPDVLPVQRAAKGEEVRGFEFELRFVDGECRWLLGDALPLFDEDGAIWGAVGAFTDITSRKHTEAELLRTNISMSRLLAAASHDLRQPAQAMTLLLQALEPHVATPGLKIVDNLHTCVSVLTTQLQSLLDLVKAQAGVVPVSFQTVPVADIIHRVVQPALPVAEMKGLRLRAHACASKVRTDPVLLERILTNLVANAVKYTERGGVLVGCRRRGKSILIQVTDTGVGISAEQIDAIWNEFYQVEPAKAGVGLGLSIVDRTARLLGCKVAVESVRGKGTTFAISLPIA